MSYSYDINGEGVMYSKRSIVPGQRTTNIGVKLVFTMYKLGLCDVHT
jgi:hypothetical protein